MSEAPPAGNRVQQIFDEAAELPTTERAAFLEVVCGADQALRAEVESLLRWDRSGLKLDTTVDLPRGTREAISERETSEFSGGGKVGPYRLEAPLGRGGQGVVYRARHEENGHLAAVKTVKVRDPGLLGSIRREIRALAALSHPQIVRILDHGVEEGTPWYAMAFLEGKSLRAVLEDNHGVAEASRAAWQARVLGIVRRLCGPLGFMHGEGLVHRDLKPENIVLQDDDVPHLVDFGLAALAGAGRESLQVKGDVMGTVPYMSPEQIRGELTDARGDLYALGCILFELLTGRPPFVGGSTTEVLMMHLKAEPVRPSQLNSVVNEALDELVLELLAKEPRGRPGHADVVSFRLRRLGVEDEPASRRTPSRPYLYRPAMAGRSEPLERVSALLRDVRKGAPLRLVLVSGESGVGRTRFAVEVGGVATTIGMRVLMGECREHGNVPLQPFLRPLEGVVDECRSRGAAYAARVIGNRGHVLAKYAYSMRALAGEGGAPEVPMGQAQKRVWQALAETLVAFGDTEPLLLVIDDLQWIDDLSLGFLRFIAEARVEPAGVLILGTYRQEEVAPDLRDLKGEDLVRVSLSALGDDAIAQIVLDMLGLETAPAGLLDSVVALAEGNPFFVAEYLRLGVAQGALFRDPDGRWQFTAPDALDLQAMPRSLEELSARLVLGLDGVARHVADAASVFGRTMDQELLGRVAAAGEEALLDGVHELCARNILEDVGGGQLRFVHDGLRRFLYGRISGDRRQHLHRVVAGVLAGRNAPPGLLASHWEAAGELEAARRAYLEAARASADRSAARDAERFYLEYLRLAEETTEESVTARQALAERVLLSLGKTQAALVQHRTAAGEARAMGIPRLELWSAIALATIHQQVGELADARRWFERSITLGRESGDASLEGRALTGLAQVEKREGRSDKAMSLLMEAKELYAGLGDRAGKALVLSTLANLKRERGDGASALELYTRAADLYEELGNRQAEGIVLGNMGHLLQGEHRLEEARARLEKAVSLLEALGDPRFLAPFQGSLGAVLHELGSREEARVLFAKALLGARDVGDRRTQGYLLTSLARLERQSGELRAAEGHLLDARRLLEEVGDHATLAVAVSEWGHLVLAGGMAARALEDSRALVAKLSLPAESPPGEAVKRLERAAAASAAGEQLVNGDVSSPSP